MKKPFFIIPLILLLSNKIVGQDSLSSEDLKNYTIHFEIKQDGSLDEPGKTFFGNEIKENQFIIFGEYHNSQAISKLTKAFIPVFKDHGGDFMALEIRPESLKLLKKLNSKEEPLVNALNEFNSQYSYTKQSGTYSAIPFLSNVSDAKFLSEAFENDIELIALDQEFIYGAIPLVTKAYENLSEEERLSNKEVFEKVVDTLNHYYSLEIDDSFKDEGEKQYFVELFHNSGFVKKFLEDISVNEENKKIVEGLRRSMEIYWQRSRSQRNYWKSNTLRTSNFIRNFRQGITDSEFDLANNKMFVKIGGLHAAKGLNNYSMYDIGNTIAELARFNDNSSLHTIFLSRYQVDNDSTVDVLDTETWYSKNFKVFLEMAKEDKWTIIDLRPMRELFYYKRKYLVNDMVRQYFDRYDVIIITPSEVEPIPNFSR